LGSKDLFFSLFSHVEIPLLRCQLLFPDSEAALIYMLSQLPNCIFPNHRASALYCLAGEVEIFVLFV